MAATKQQILDWVAGLTSRGDRRVIIGQQICGRALDIQSCYDHYFLDLETATGQQPALIGFQWRRYNPTFTAQNIALMSSLAQDHWDAGGLVVIIPNFPNPWNESYANDTDRPLWGLEDLVDDQTAVYDTWHSMIDDMMEEFKVMTDEGVIIIFRPFRECTGGWYWWGPVPDAGNEWNLNQSRYIASFVAMWEDLRDYVEQEHGMADKLIWLYTTANRDQGRDLSAQWPGSSYADWAGASCYEDDAEITSPGYTELDGISGAEICYSEHGPYYPNTGNYNCMVPLNKIKTGGYSSMVMIMWWATWGEDYQEAIVDNAQASNLMNDPWSIVLGLVEPQEGAPPEPPEESTEVYKDDDSLVGFWAMEEASGTRYDQSVSLNHLTDNNTVSQSADQKEGTYSADFESGNNEYLNITDANQSGLALSGEFTICMWIKAESVAASQVLAAKYVTSGDQRSYMAWLILSGGSVYPRLNVSSNGSTYSAVQADTPVSAGTWVHLAFVYDGSELIIYRDAESDCTPTSFSSAVFDSTSEFRLGRHPENTWPYDGLMDEVLVFNRALTATQINDIYTNGIRNPPVYDTDVNLRALYRLEETSGTRYDSSPNDDNDLTDGNSVGYSTDSQEGDNSADFEDTSSQYLTIADASQTGLDLSDRFTLLCWVKPETLTAVSRHALVSKFDIDGGDRAYQLSLLLDTGNYYARISVSPDGAAATHHRGDTAISAGTWYHVAAVYDGSELRIYIDGDLDSAPTTSFTSSLNNSDAAFELGRGQNDTFYYDGLLDEVAVFDRALLQGEIQYIIASGIVAPSAPPAEEPISPPPSLTPGMVYDVQYRLDFLNISGVKVAEVWDFLGLSYVKKVNTYGLCRFLLPGDHHSIATLGHRYIVEVWRRVPNAGLDWYRDFQGLFLDQRRFWSGASYFEGIAPGILWLLSTRHVAWKAGTANRSQFTSSPAETILKRLVDYNCAANATTANGRERAGVISGLTVEATSSGGNTITWACAWKNVLAELTKIADIAGGDFDLVEQSAANWEFQWFAGQRGSDLSASLTFNLERGNMGNPSYRMNRIQEGTVAIVAGRGREDSRATRIVAGPDYSASNDVEIFVDSSQSLTQAALQAVGNQKLSEAQAKGVLTFDVLQTPATMYGIHYCVDGVMGDLVTADYEEVEETHKVIQVSVALSQDGTERIDIQTEAN